jgi:hypothetical protein
LEQIQEQNALFQKTLSKGDSALELGRALSPFKNLALEEKM